MQGPLSVEPRDVASDLSGSSSSNLDRYSAKAMDSDLMIPMVAFQLAAFPDITAHCTSYALGSAFNTFLETLTAQELARVFTVACHDERVKELLGDRAEEAATHEKAVIIREANGQVKKFFVGSGNFDDPAILLGLRGYRADRNTNSGVLFSVTEPGGLDRLVNQWTAVRLNPEADLDNEQEDWIVHYRASLESLRNKKAEAKDKAIADSGASDRRVSCDWCGAVLCHQSAVDTHQRNNCPKRGENGVVVGALLQCRGVKGNRNARCGVTCANPEARDKHETEKHQLYICKDAACPVGVDKRISNMQPWMVQKNWGSLAERAAHMLKKGCVTFTGNLSSVLSLLAAFIGCNIPRCV
jgi:hypothetical protein